MARSSSSSGSRSIRRGRGRSSRSSRGSSHRRRGSRSHSLHGDRRGRSSSSASRSRSRNMSRRERSPSRSRQRSIERCDPEQAARSAQAPPAVRLERDDRASKAKNEVRGEQRTPHHGSNEVTRGDGELSLIRRAAALRLKYKKNDQLVQIPVMQIGAHPENRDGQGPSSSRCYELLGKLLGMNQGFDVVEANSNGVLVEQKPGSTHIQDANSRFADGDDLLAPTVGGHISYGTLSHSTLNQVMRNISARCRVANAKSCAGDDLGAPPTVVEDEGVLRIVDSTGRLSLGLLQEVDPAFANAIHTGLSWEILSSAIEDEEPDGCAVIQAALNAKNSLFMVTHEMQAISRLMGLASSPVVTEKKNKWEYVLRRMRETMPQFCDDKNFIDLYAFVADMGGDQSWFLHDLKVFHQKFVNPQLRRLRLDAFAVVNQLSLESPHLKMAFVKYLYVEGKYSNGYCTMVHAKTIKSLAGTAEGQAASAIAEDILRFFHVPCLAVIRKLGDAAKTQFFGNLDKDIFAELSDTVEPALRETNLRSCGARYHRRLVRMCVGQKVPAFTLGTRADSAPTMSTASSSETTMQPKVIAYDENGRPTCKQEVASESRTEVFGWSDFMQTICMTETLEETGMKSMIIAQIHLLHKKLPQVTEDHVKLTKGSTRGIWPWSPNRILTGGSVVGEASPPPLPQNSPCLPSREK